MGVSKGMDMFRQRIKMATRKKFSPGEKDAAKFYVDQMKDSLEKSSLGIDFRDQNRMCDDYAEKMEKRKRRVEWRKKRRRRLPQRWTKLVESRVFNMKRSDACARISSDVTTRK